MILLYRLLTWCVTPFFWLWGLFQTRTARANWRERHGETDKSCDVWLHAASVGEITLLEPLITLLHEKRPSLRIHITSMTAAGVKQAQSLYGKACSVSFAPFDLPLVMTRWLDRLQPKMVGIAETEIWPNLILGCTEKQIPIVLINGRMSARAAAGYALIRGTIRSLLARYTHLFVRSEADAMQFRSFGIDQNQMTLAGDLKFDAPVELLDAATRSRARNSLGISDSSFLVVAGSTRPGEEEHLLSCYDTLSAEQPGLRLLLAPRHLERIDEVTALIQQHGLHVHLIDSLDLPPSTSQQQEERQAVLLVTRMGLLKGLYQLADLSFVGGTLVPIGGHNLLEPVWAGSPVLFGSSIENVSDAARYITAHHFGKQVADRNELRSEILSGMKNPSQYARKSGHPLTDSAASRIAEFFLTTLQ